MPELWYPPASKVQTFDSKYPGMVFPRLDGTIFHTTEGVDWPPYGGGASAPNFTAKPDWANKKVLWRQHFQVNRSSRALAGSVGGTSTNRFHINQVEIIGTSGWATTRNPNAVKKLKGTYIIDDKWYVPNYPDWFWQGIADFLRWENKEWGVPLVAPMKFVSFLSDNRMSVAQWNAFRGIAGHQHVPYNDHNDPGLIPIDKILSMAKGTFKPATPAPAPAPKPIPKENPVDINQTTFTKYFNAALDNPEIAKKIKLLAIGATYGDVNKDGKADTVGQLVADTAKNVNKLLEQKEGETNV